MKAKSPDERKKFIGIKQAKRTIQKIERRKRLGNERPTDPQLLFNARKIIAQLENKQ